MNEPHLEWQWLDAGELLDLNELSCACEMSADELNELIEYGALSPGTEDPGGSLFPAHFVSPLRIASKLRRDYDLDLFTVALLMDYLHQIERLQAQLLSLQARTP